MAVNSSRSQTRSLHEGATDGKYRKARPDTEVIAGMGDETVRQSRAHLHPPMNYGFVGSQVPPDQQVSPA